MRTAKFTTGYEAVYRLVEGFLELLERRKMTRADLARRLEVKRPVVTRWFGGSNLTVFTAARIAEALGAELRFEFIDKTEQPVHRPELIDPDLKTVSLQVLPLMSPEYCVVLPSASDEMGEAVFETAAVYEPRRILRGSQRAAMTDRDQDLSWTHAMGATT